MSTVLTATIPSTCDLRNEQMWADLVDFLRIRTRHFVYSAHVVDWLGQQEEIIEDIVQETVSRIFERARRAECGEAVPIRSLKHIAVRTAHNFFVDMLRR